MESWLSPVGPLPAAVYWRRRALVVAAVVIVGWMFAQFAGSDAAAKQGQQARHTQTTPTTRTTPKAVAKAPAAHSTASTARGTARVGAPAAGGAAKGGVTTGTTAVQTLHACRAGAISLAVATDQPSYAAGSEPRITLTVTNTSTSTCTADLGPKARVLTITSGSDRIWSSADCGGSTSTVTALAPKQSIAYALTWGRHRSRPSCSGTTRAALPGTYKVTAHLGDATAPSAVFSLR